MGVSGGEFDSQKVEGLTQPVGVGVRAVANKTGLEATGGNYAARFYGDVMVEGDHAVSGTKSL
jgi:hypothetical protein